MRTRIIAAVAAGALALVGVIALVVYARGASDRAYEGADLTRVVQVKETIAKDTKVADLGQRVGLVDLPKDAVPSGAVTDLAAVSDQSTTVSLEPGEVLLSSRLAAPGERGGDDVDVPKGTQEMSVDLDPQRVVGGRVKAGDRIGVIANFDPDGQQSNFGNLVAHDVLVTRIDKGDGESAQSTVQVTMAVKTRLAEKLAFAMEYGKVWLTLQNTDTDTKGQKVITDGDFR